jgi:hypothetical protein
MKTPINGFITKENNVTSCASPGNHNEQEGAYGHILKGFC